MADATVNPADWGKDVEVLDGIDLLDKAELIGKPFLITEVRFQTSTRGYDMVYVNAQFKDGTVFQFVDSSSGVKTQIENFLELKEIMPKGNDEIVPIKLLILKGLRVSEFVATDERGREKKARTYYLTTSGKI
jgi:hypothetical protein